MHHILQCLIFTPYVHTCSVMRTERLRYLRLILVPNVINRSKNTPNTKHHTKASKLYSECSRTESCKRKNQNHNTHNKLAGSKYMHVKKKKLVEDTSQSRVILTGILTNFNELCGQLYIIHIMDLRFSHTGSGRVGLTFTVLVLKVQLDVSVQWPMSYSRRRSFNLASSTPTSGMVLYTLTLRHSTLRNDSSNSVIRKAADTITSTDRCGPRFWKA